VAFQRRLASGCHHQGRVGESKGTYVNACWSWDCTFKDVKTSDYVVGICVVQIGAQYYVIELVRDLMDFPASKRAVQLAQGRWIMPAILVEDSANGTALVADLRESVPGLISRPTRGESKESRASAVSPRVEAGNVILCTAPWNSAFVEELAAFSSALTLRMTPSQGVRYPIDEAPHLRAACRFGGAWDPKACRRLAAPWRLR
jgi:predicted phage terminase large subunit-like protein